MADRIWLDVPYAHKEYAKKAGARWDPNARRWYAPSPGMTSLTRWAPKNPNPAPTIPPPAPAMDDTPSPSPTTRPAPAPSRAGAGAAARAAELARAERPRVLLAGVVGGAAGLLLGVLLDSFLLALVLGAAAATGAALWQRGRGAAARWRRGAVGEQRTGRLLAPLTRRGWTVLHDRQLPRSRANVDHLAISPDGQVFNIDSKNRRGRVRYNARRNHLKIGRTSGYQLTNSTLFESEQIAQTLAREIGPVQVVSVLAVHRARLPHWHDITIRGVRVMSARSVPAWLDNQSHSLSTRGKEVAAAAERLFPAYVQR